MATNPVITMKTTAGTITAELYPEVAPITVNNFISLINKGFYNGLIFHRVINGFMIQGGDPDGIGTGGPGYHIRGEFAQNGYENNLKHTAGVLSMARSMMPNSAGSQFFIMHKDAPHLDGAYAAFGKVTEGMDVVNKIAEVRTDYSDRPMEEQKMKKVSLEQELKGNAYPGRGIVIGRSKDGTKAVAGYFIMGRSQNSRNRVFVEEGEGIRTQAFDPSKLEDPSLIIYAPVRVLGNDTIVTNGDQTDTVYEGLEQGKTFEVSLRSREFEPDAPNYTPRISGVMHVENGTYGYQMSILKSNNGDPSQCNRYTFSYDNCVAGEGHFIHTYMHDGNPLPSFEGEPKLVEIPDDIDAFTELLWSSLNEDNKVSLFTRYIDIATGKYETRIVNKNK